jgi:hypothetical protein
LPCNRASLKRFLQAVSISRWTPSANFIPTLDIPVKSFSNHYLSFLGNNRIAPVIAG